MLRLIQGHPKSKALADMPRGCGAKSAIGSWLSGIKHWAFIGLLAVTAASVALLLVGNLPQDPPQSAVAPVVLKRTPADIEKEIIRLAECIQISTAPPKRMDCVHFVESGDSLLNIAREVRNMYGLAEKTDAICNMIMERNAITDSTRLQVGDALEIPLTLCVKPQDPPVLDRRLSMNLNYWSILEKSNRFQFDDGDMKALFDVGPRHIYYSVQEGDTLYDIARRIRDTERIQMPLKWFVQEIAATNDLDEPTAVHPETLLDIVVSDQRTMAGMLAYDGYHGREGPIKLHYGADEIRIFAELALQKYRNVPKDMFFRMLRVESGGNHMAISPVGAAGLLQIMPLTAKRLGLRIWNENGYVLPRDIALPGAKALYMKYANDLKEMAASDPRKLMQLDDRFNPQKNALAAARLLSRLVTQYGERQAVAMYNGGWRGATNQRALETKRYLSLVLP